MLSTEQHSQFSFSNTSKKFDKQQCYDNDKRQLNTV